MQDNYVAAAAAINVGDSINSGQVFLWKKDDNFWYGIDGQNVLRISSSGEIRSHRNTKTDFLRKDDDMEKIIRSISRDKTTSRAVKKYPGLRLLRQDPFQCLISFIVSSNSNIQKIKINLEKLSKKFGERVEFDNQEFFLFPKPGRLARAPAREILKCGIGYRSKFVRQAAKMIASKKIDLESLKKIGYFDAKKNICLIPGVGNKVADCIMLFSLNKLEAVPLDRWMIKILEKYYLEKFALETKTITEKQYDILHEKIVNHFGPYAGYAQQFLFKMERDNYQKKWL